MRPLVIESAGRDDAGLEPDDRAELVRMMHREIGREMAADRAPHVDGAVEFKFARERGDELQQKIFGEFVFAAPPFDAGRRHRFGVVGQVVRDHAEVALQLGVFEQMTPLPAIRARGMLQQQRNSAPRFLEVDAILDAVNAYIDVAADCGVETWHR